MSPTSNRHRRTPRPVLGWREWLALPELGIERIKAKVDTGARSSALHAFDVERTTIEGRDAVRFFTEPKQRSSKIRLQTEALIHDVRRVKSSNGAVEERLFIRTTVRLAGEDWPIELALTDRDDMGFRMLLGRAAIRRRFLVDPGRSYLGEALEAAPPNDPPHAAT